MIDRERLRRAYQTARLALLAERTPEGHWVGELSSSALSTATACSALAIVDREKFRSLIDAGLRWIFERQNADGGWGDTDLSLSNISTTMLVRAATHLAGVVEQHAAALERAEEYIAAKGGIVGLRKRYGKDKTFAVPILTNCALAGLVPWSEVSSLPFELACLPQSWYRFVRLPVVSYAIPALVAIGQARYFHKKPWNPLARLVRAASVERSLTVLEKMQPASGGYLEATPLTSFVVMSLASIGRQDHPVTGLGVKFLLDSVRADGSWPIDTNLATWVTTLSINALTSQKVVRLAEYKNKDLMQWILDCQHSKPHPFTGAAPGGWGWSDLSGAVPDADDTPGTLMAISDWYRDHQPTKDLKWDNIDRTNSAVEMGFNWLLGLQNRDGGWPTFCRGWGKLPFDRSGTDLTAHVVRALKASSEDIIRHYEANENAKLMVDDLLFGGDRFSDAIGSGTKTKESLDCQTKAQNAINLGFRFLKGSQRPDGSWLPLWFGNQHGKDDENPLYGTARVLLAYRDLGRMQDEPARRGVDYLLTQQNADGGFGGDGSASSVEETAVVVEALLAGFERPEVQSAARRGLIWLVEAVETGRFRRPSPIGFYFAKLWYYEKLYPMIFTVGALRTAVETLDTENAH